jgi:LysM repeat protein
MINATPFPEGEAWTVVVPESCWTTQETADAITAAAKQVRAWNPEGAPVRVGQVSGPEGGYLPPHITHQNGRDIDVGLFYPGPEPYRVKEREKVMDVAMNWAFAKAILMHGDVQGILLDKRVQKVLYDYALAHGENKQWLDSLFNAGKRSIFHHARRHRDHFHVRLFNPRAQELAYRLAPLMPVRPDENIAFHRVVKGDTLGGIAQKLGSSVKKIKSVNHLANAFLRLGQVLKVPLKGPCTNCPVPPMVVVPPRRLPPSNATSSTTEPGKKPQG